MVLQIPYLAWLPPVIGHSLFVPIVYGVFRNLWLWHGIKFYLPLILLLFHWIKQHKHKWFFLTILKIFKENNYLFINSLISSSRFWSNHWVFGGDQTDPNPALKEPLASRRTYVSNENKTWWVHDERVSCTEKLHHRDIYHWLAKVA